MEGPPTLIYLMYCVFREPFQIGYDFPDGVGGQRVFTISCGGLVAALSELGRLGVSPKNSVPIAYEAVVDYFHRHITVIPMRYGHCLSDPHRAATLLKENRDAYLRLLDHFDGLAEMRIQVLLDRPELEARTHRLFVQSDWSPSQSNSSGTANLEPTDSRYRWAEPALSFQKALVENLCDAPRGSLVRHNVEFPSLSRGRHLNLHFLVPRDSVRFFCQTANNLAANRSVKVLLGGPWPPYHFVDVAETSAGMKARTSSRLRKKCLLLEDRGCA